MSNPEVELRARLATKIKNMLYPDDPWPKVVGAVANYITAVLRVSKAYYPDMEYMEFVRTVSNYDDAALKDAFEMISNSKDGSGATCIGNQPNAISALLTRSMASS